MSESNPIRQFAQLMQCEDVEINLAEAALLIARTEYPQLDLRGQLDHLDRLAARVRTRPDSSFPENIRALNELLFEVEGFSGDEEEYDDPRNSYLNEVLARKKGIPITLSVVYIEVASRRGIPVVGIGFPGHFLVKYLAEAGEVFIDPFHQGAILSREDCAARLKAQFGEEAELRPEYLAASTPKQVLARMLSNLKGSYFRRRQFSKILPVIELALGIDPASRQELRDRGMVHFLMKRYAQAQSDFTAYLRLSPQDDPDAGEVLKAIHRIRAMMN
jgi:regulator of sirC expression with transglutaminase-like and TPR domain